jgi:DNA-binding beta-propeller fold protein YncE
VPWGCTLPSTTKLAFLLLAGTMAPAQLRLEKTIPLAGVEGRIDHLAADPSGKRLFVAALGNNTLEALDLAAGRLLRSIAGFHEPQGIAFAPDLGRLFVANGEDGQVSMLDSRSLRQLGTTGFGGDADNLRYDAASRRVWVGYGDGAMGEIDGAAGKRLGDVKLPAHPESFQLEKNGPRLFVNVPKAGRVAVIDRRLRTVKASWPVPGASANFPMALDEDGRRLFVGCRKPAEVLVYDTDTGTVTARFPCPGDTDDLFYDAARRRLYVSGGEGSIGVFRCEGGYERMALIRTAAGARTSLFVPDLGRLYLAVPHRAAQQAEIRVYRTE